MSKIKTYREFWPFYLGEHRNRTNRVLHYIGTTTGVLVFLYALFTQTWMLIPVALVIGYAFAWVGHFVFEKNRPATFKHPFWSFISDYKMVFYAMTGNLKDE